MPDETETSRGRLGARVGAECADLTSVAGSTRLAAAARAVRSELFARLSTVRVALLSGGAFSGRVSAALALSRGLPGAALEPVARFPRGVGCPREELSLAFFVRDAK